MKNKDEIRQELKQLGATKLINLHKRPARPVLPDDYWNNHIDKVITAGGETPDNQPGRHLSLSYIVTIAAGVLMLLAGAWMFFQSVTTESDMAIMVNELAMISDEEIVKYIDDNLDDFDLTLLTAYTQEPEHDLLFEIGVSLDSMEENWPKDAEWLMPDEEGIDLF